MWQTTSISIGYYILWVWNFSVIKYPTNLCFLVNCPYVLFLKCLLNDKGMKDLASETSFTSRINLKLRSGFVRHESYRHFFTNLNEIGEGATFDETLIWWIRWKDYLNHLPIWGTVMTMKYVFYSMKWYQLQLIFLLLCAYSWSTPNWRILVSN